MVCEYYDDEGRNLEQYEKYCIVLNFKCVVNEGNYGYGDGVYGWQFDQLCFIGFVKCVDKGDE